MADSISLAIFDTGLCMDGKTPSAIHRDSLETILMAEKAGYTRYWMSEHHDPHYAWTSPALMIPYLASRTSTIRLGTAAILLGLYPPLQAAETYRTLEAMFPGRIDYGVGSASPTSDETRTRLMGGQKISVPDLASRFEQNLVEMHSYLHNNYPADTPFQCGATPVINAQNTTWIMGTGMGSAIIAAKHSTAFSYSLFHRFSKQVPAISEHYRSEFIPGNGRLMPCCNIAVSVVCAPTEAEALKQKTWIESVQSDFQINVYGDAESCVTQLRNLARIYQTNELVIFMMWHIFEKRLEGLQLLAERFADIGRRSAPTMEASMIAG